jgi:predicted phage terminase large subunit-like protein
MQRLHVDDLVAHVQEHEEWNVLSLSAIAEEHDWYGPSTPYGWANFERQVDDVLQPTLMSRESLEIIRGANEYDFSAQFQQNPEPPSGIIVKREWLKFYSPDERPKGFEMTIQAWDTASKSTDLSSFSVCTTWGLKNEKLYLLDVYREKPEYPDLKRAVKRLAVLHSANVVLVEEQSSGVSLLQELRAERFSIAQPAPSLPGDKIMRLRAQTAKIEGGFVLFPKEATWLAEYIKELISFPNSKHADQVDSTVYALAWMTLALRWPGWTDEALAGLDRFTTSLEWQRRFRALTGR